MTAARTFRASCVIGCVVGCVVAFVTALIVLTQFVPAAGGASAPVVAPVAAQAPAHLPVQIRATAIVPMQSNGPECPAGMQLTSGRDRCLTPRVRWSQPTYRCPTGYRLLVGEFGGSQCQRTVTTRVQTGTRRVFSHNTYESVWVDTGRQRQQTGTRREWVPARTTVEPIVPPIRRQVGTTRTWVPPATTTQVIRTGTRTERTRECNVVWELGTSVCSWVEREVPVYEAIEVVLTPGRWRVTPTYEWQRSQTITIPGYYRTVPVYGWVRTGYYDRVARPQYRIEPVYETRSSVETVAARSTGCASGWTPSGGLCRRVELGLPSAVPTRRVQAPSTDEVSNAPAVPVEPEVNLDRSLARLASLGDAELSSLGLHRCTGGLISQVPCGSQPSRTWNVDADACQGIAGTTATAAHGGSCRTGVDTLTKCQPGGRRCRQVTVRTFCPRIAQLSGTRILSWQETEQGKQGETYRACVFDCTNFAALPAYVAHRIQSSADYHCAATPSVEAPRDPPRMTTTQPPVTTTTRTPTTTSSSASTTTTSSTTTSVPRRTTTSVPRRTPPLRVPPTVPPVRVPPTTRPRVTQPRVTQPRVTQPRVTQPRVTQPPVTQPTPTTTPQCSRFPAGALRAAASRLRFETPIAATGAARADQTNMPGRGLYVVLAPGVGWVVPPTGVWTLDILSNGCAWRATELRVTWTELVPWRHAAQIRPIAPEVVRAWQALSAADQATVRSHHVTRRAITSCSPAQLRSDPRTACNWFLAEPAVYRWELAATYRPSAAGVSQRSQRIAGGVAHIRSLSEFGDRG